MLSRRGFLQSLTAGSAIAQSADSPKQPNILFVLLDDLGWRDTGPYGNEFIDTPNLNRFAAESTRFTSAYAACPVCSPTRASILTGQYPARLHLTDWIPGRKQWPYAKLLTPQFNQLLPPESKTIPQLLVPQNYRTAAIGKWHLGGTGHLPTDYGFGINIGGSAAGHPPSYFGPLELPGLSLKPGEFLTQRLTDEGVRFIKAESTQPFFLYQAHFTVHLPLQAREEMIAKYRRRDTGDVDPVYCAMVESADDSVGQLLRALEESGQAHNTVVILFSDNGGVRYQVRSPKPVTSNRPLRAGKGHLYEGGVREPLMIRWPGVTKAGSTIDQPVSSVDFLPWICRLTGASYNAVDGLDLSPLLRGETLRERPLFWHYPHYSDQGGKPSGAVRLDEWKLIEFFEDGRLELFHLLDDPGEQRNLVRREPQRTRQLLKLLKDWRGTVQAAMPTPNPRFDPAQSSEHLTGYEAATPPL